MPGLVLSVLLVLAAAFLAGTGAALLRGGEKALQRLGHLPQTLVQAFAGRYFAMSAMILALALAGEIRALGLILLIGAAMGLFDAVIVGRAGGARPPHLVAAAVCLLLAAWCLVAA
jgi:hypothetical protein